jgi:hypothetical protein
MVHPEHPACFVVQKGMNPLARVLMPSIAGLLLAVVFAAAALTNQPPLVVTPLTLDGSSNLVLKPLNSAPIVRLSGNPGISRPLEPGVYQTRPYAIILVAPKAGLDDHCVMGTTGVGSKMPVVKPGVQVVPILPSK